MTARSLRIAIPALALAFVSTASAVPRETVRGPDARTVLHERAARELDALGWEAAVDPSSGFPLRAWGAPITVDRGIDAQAAASEFLARRPGLTGFAPDGGHELVPRETFRAGAVTAVRFEQRWNGIPVEGAAADVRMNREGVVMSRLHVARSIDAETRPLVSEAAALATGLDAALALGHVTAAEPRLDESRPLAIVRHGDRWRLAFLVRVDAEGPPPARLVVRVDARDGSLLSVTDDVRSADTTLTIRAWHEPRTVGDTLVLAPLQFHAAFDDQDRFVTDSAGMAVVSVSGASRMLTLSLDGEFARVAAWSGTAATASIEVFDGVPAEHVWDESSARIAELDAAVAHQVVRARMKRMAPDLPWLDTQVSIVVDMPGGGCNAFWNGVEAQFYDENETCNATGRLADVVYHELGHGFHGALAAGGSRPPDIGEGSSDYLAATITGDPDIAPGFFKATPEGLRNLEPDLVFPDDVNGSPHHDGLIWGGAFWDLRKALIATLGTDAGIVTADRIFTDSLRFDPSMEDGFWDVLLAADDDGNLSNGGPFECEVVAAFGAHGLGPGDGLTIVHEPLGVQRPDVAPRIRAHVAAAFPRCGSSALVAADVEWRLEGEDAWRNTPLVADLVPGWRVATLPPAPEGSVIEYRVRAFDAAERLATSPARHADVAPFRVPVDDRRIVFFDDFETDRGWTHELVEGNDIVGADDWQRGLPMGRGGDPFRAFSGTHVWGNDLGADPFNGRYQPNVHNRLESPTIDCRRCVGARLTFRRWLGVQERPVDGEGDRASVWVNGRRIWSSPSDRRLRDGEWRLEDFDISDVADGRRIRIRFELETDGGVHLGGWNLDDVTVSSTGLSAPGCGCSLDTEGPSPAGALAIAAVLAALVAVRRQR